MNLPLWLIPALPLAGFLLNGSVALFAGWRRARKSTAAWREAHPEDHGHDGDAAAGHGHDDHGHDAHGPSGPFLPYGERLFYGVVGVLSVGLATVVALANAVPYALASTASEGGIGPVVQSVWKWMAAGHVSVEMAFRLDPLSAMMVSFVTFVGLLIHVFSVGYMQDEEGYGRYFAYLNLFMFAMLTLILADSLVVLFIGWEGVGLCSYLLIGYYYDKDFAHAAGKKAFVTNRIGDFGMVLGIFGILALFGTTDFSFVDLAKAGAMNGTASITVYAVCLLLFLGAVGKSAQVPLYVWLPDAMAGPTPVSALIHAATMVTAGVYLVARCSAVFVLAPDALTLVAWVGAGTAVFAATIGLAQNDIKKVLAYSTVSQLGYMFLACGVGAFGVGMFHVFTHAFFKACLFLGSGSVIMAMHHEQDMRAMGGLAPKVKRTYLTMMVATVAIAGIPPLAGFFSKDQILGAAFAGGHLVLFAIGLFTAGMTAFYMFRLARMTFYGEFRGTEEAEKHVHESPATMTVPLIVLAAGSILVGFLGVPEALGGSNRFVSFLAPSLATAHPHHLSHATEYVLMALSVAVAAAGILLAWRWYGQKGATPEVPSAAAQAFYEKSGALGRLVANKWYVDEGIEAAVLSPFRKIGTFLWRGFDSLVIDGIVNASAFLVELTGDLVRFFTTGNVRNYALSFSLGVLVLALYVFLR
ncbi:MAG TPA: NADH-quinone oxidoreductase subunit L [Thermoanaerobaculia bacterium]|jgi:NADH-quinone oxidoreductase subunit L|nr:NADH-quinone oxidoreductase subunit L [Thermoanaerobaculia bacterium]HQP88282.1 NADH-quinone oxidoreductase subunit L [Thermoanaerobaculia bacterium]